ncbi:MAG: gliding motility-associated C-terminal domain-containing protein [Bacteroidales bacterium]
MKKRVKYLQRARWFPDILSLLIQQLRQPYESLSNPRYDRLWPLHLLLLFALLTGGVAFGQITSPQADAVRSVSYTTAEGGDPLFVFYQSHGNSRPGSLRATGPTAGNFDFVWTEYDPDSDGFNIPVASEIGISTSTVTGLNEGGYQVQVSNGTDTDTTFIAWVMLNSLVVYTEKDENGELESFRSGCSDGNFIVIAGGVEIDSFYYYDPVSHERILYPNDFDIRWTSDNPDLTIFNPTNKDAMGANYSNAPPYKDTYYILSATDSTGMTEVDSVFYDTKHTKAEFTVKYLDKVTLDWEDELGTGFEKEKGSKDAPLSVRFFNESQNGYEFTWVYLDTTDELTGLSTKEMDVTSDENFEPEFTYYTANRYYYPYLVSESDAGCIDTFRLEDGIRVVPSQLVIPNVFTPNGDEINDVFKFKHQSLKECRITISDRWGRVVYRKKIDNIYEWEGWRGTILNTEREAPEGQYYYVVEGMGFDNVEYKDPNYFEQRKINRQDGDGTGTGGQNGDEDAQQLNLYTGWLYLFRQKGTF